MRRAPFSTLFLVALAVASLSTILLGAYAVFTARTMNPGTQVATGTLRMSNSRDTAAIFVVTNLRPGESASGTVTITNSGTLLASYALSVSNVVRGGTGTGDLRTILTLVITDELSRTVYSGLLSSMPPTALPGTGGGAWAAAEAHTYTFVATVPLSADNTYQDTSVTADYVWDATQ